MEIDPPPLRCDVLRGSLAMAAAAQYTAIESVSSSARKKLSASPSLGPGLRGGADAGVGVAGGVAGVGVVAGGVAGRACCNGTRTIPGKVFWKGRYIDQSLIYQVNKRGAVLTWRNFFAKKKLQNFMPIHMLCTRSVRLVVLECSPSTVISPKAHPSIYDSHTCQLCFFLYPHKNGSCLMSHRYVAEKL